MLLIRERKQQRFRFPVVLHLEKGRVTITDTTRGSEPININRQCQSIKNARSKVIWRANSPFSKCRTMQIWGFILNYQKEIEKVFVGNSIFALQINNIIIMINIIKRIIKLVWRYIVSILVFSVIYYFIYMIDSTSFIVEKQYNQHLVSVLNIWESLDEIESIKTNLPDDIYDFNMSISPLLDSLRTLNNNIKYLEMELESTKNISDSVSTALNKSRTNDIEQELSSYIKLEKDTLNRIQNNIKMIMEEDSLNGEYLIAKSGLSVYEAQLKYRIAIKELKFRKMVLKNFGSFGDQELHDSYSLLLNRQNLLTDSIFNMQDNYRKIKSDTAHKVIQFHKKRIEQVGYIDFLYFSTMTAFSNNLGDIIPNSKLTRAIVALQILISIILITYISDKMLRMYNNEE